MFNKAVAFNQKNIFPQESTIKKTTRIIKLLRDKLNEKHGTRREDVTDHYESNPNCFTDKRLAKHETWRPRRDESARRCK